MEKLDGRNALHMINSSRHLNHRRDSTCFSEFQKTRVLHVTYAHLWLQVFIFAKLSRCSYLSFSEMTPGEDVSQKSLGELISNLASLLAQMVVMDHLSESAPRLIKSCSRNRPDSTFAAALCEA